MRLIYEGKTKSVYQLEGGNILLKFKDDVTGEDGVFDPGANTVGLSIAGMGQGALRMTTFFFDKISAAGYPTHYISADIDKAEMIVLPAKIFGNGLEVICRFRATGSFIRRYGMYAKEGQPLDALVEVTLKDDERKDPLIPKDTLVALEILTAEEYETLVSLTKNISELVRGELAKKDLELYDIKLEFGRVGPGGKIALIDEISAGNMRAYKDGQLVPPLDLVKLLLG